MKGANTQNGVTTPKAFELYLSQYSNPNEKPVNLYFEMWSRDIKENKKMASIEDYFRRKSIATTGSISYKEFIKLAHESLNLNEEIYYTMFKSCIINNKTPGISSAEGKKIEESSIQVNDLIDVLESYLFSPSPESLAVSIKKPPRLPYSTNSQIIKLTDKEKSRFEPTAGADAERQMVVLNQKISNSKCTFGMAIEKVNWSADGKVRASEIESTFSECFRNILSEEEIKTLMHKLIIDPSGEVNNSISINKAIQIYDKYFESLIDDTRVICFF